MPPTPPTNTRRRRGARNSSKCLLDEPSVAERLGTTPDSIRWLRRTGKLRFIRLGHNSVRFFWSQVIEDLKRLEVRCGAQEEAK